LEANKINLNQAFVSLFVFIGLFAVIFGFMPGGYLYGSYTPPTTTERAVAAAFSANDITLYANSWNGTLTRDGAKLENGSDLPEGHLISVQWITTGGYSHVIAYHISPGTILWILPSPFPDYEWMEITHDGIPVDQMFSSSEFGITRNVTEYAENNEAASFTATCAHATLNLLFMPKAPEDTLLESFDAGNMTLYASYEIDFESMKPSAWMLLSSVLSFQSPELGVPGDGGTILNYILGASLWAVIIVIVYTAVTRLIPTITGGMD